MAKELKTAEQLSEMIVAALGVKEVYVSVRKDHAYGWQPTVVSSPGDTIVMEEHRQKTKSHRERLQPVLPECLADL
jgi:hypothetical protein